MRVNGGSDWQSALMGSATGVPAIYMGLTSDSTAPAPTDTTLASEIVSGTMVRTACTYAHTTGTNSYTLSHTFTADQTITIQKIGVFTASTGGTMVFETLLNAPASLVTGDTLLAVESVTI